MAFKSEKHRRWYFANKKKGTLPASSSFSGKRKYKKKSSSSFAPSAPFPSSPPDWL